MYIIGGCYSTHFCLLYSLIEIDVIPALHVHVLHVYTCIKVIVMKIPSSLLKLSLFACAQEVVQDALLRGCLPLAQAYLLQRKTGPHRNTEQVVGTRKSICMGL